MTEKRELRCVIAAGGTGGHVLPSLAIASALRERGVSVTFAGSPDRIEARLVPAAGYELDPFRVSGFPRRVGTRLLRALAQAAAAPFACRAILARRRPHVVLGGGGYVAGPMVLAAWTRGIPAALTEGDAQLGLANRLAAPFARRLFLSFPIEGREGGKYVVTGRPVRPPSTVPRAEARAAFGLPADGPAVLVFGGSLGARVLNEAAVAAWAGDGPAVLHLCGERYHDGLRARVSRPGYVLLPWTDAFGDALAACDLVVARSGGSVYELAAAGTPAVLVPSPNVTADHQTKNARHFERAGGAVVLPEPEIGALGEVVAGLLAEPARLAAMGEAMRAAARPDAADRIADELVALAGGGR